MSDTATHVFLFDADYPGVSGYYGGEFDPAFLRALAGADPTGLTSSRILRGDVIVRALCEKTVAVSRKPDRRGSNTISATVSTDMELFQLLVWDIAEAIAGQWHTTDDEKFPFLLARHNVHCICLPTLPVIFREAIDSALRATPAYCGSIEVDTGNPIQFNVFVRLLIGSVGVDAGYALATMDHEGHPEDILPAANLFLPNGSLLVNHAEFLRRLPLTTQSKLSPRGEVSRDRFIRKRSFSIYERVAGEFFTTSVGNSKGAAFSFDTSAAPKGFDEIEVPAEKLVVYVLNPNHPKSGGKAKFFITELGIDASNWRYLAAQIANGLKTATIRKVHTKHFEESFGLQYSASVPVVGLNGRTMTIETGWIVNPGARARLVTAYPAEPDDRLNKDAAEPRIVDPSLKNEEKWAVLFELADQAGKEAITQCVPTPMKIEGCPVIFEGACGGAYIRIPDARTGFARWVIKAGKGCRHYKSGAQVFAYQDNQSADQAAAYARAFATVLHQNGVECRVTEYLN